MNSRLIKILFAYTAGLYISLVCLNNLIDYRSNFAFVSMVVKMEDTFSLQRNGWRSVHSQWLQHLLFIVIIVWEGVIAICLFTGARNMVSKFHSSAVDFKAAKSFATWGFSLGVLLWFLVFIAIGGEWFLMWQSKTWNAQNTAFLLTTCFLLFLLHHNQDDNWLHDSIHLSAIRKLLINALFSSAFFGITEDLMPHKFYSKQPVFLFSADSLIKLCDWILR